MPTATKPQITDLQNVILKKLSTYKQPKTSKEIVEALKKSNKKAGLLSVQQVAANLRALEQNFYVQGNYRAGANGGVLEWSITGKGKRVIGK